MTTTFAVVLIIASTISVSLMLVLLHNLRRQNKTEKLLNTFNGTAAAFNLSIAQQEILGIRVIGFDHMNNKLLFLEAGEDKHDGYLIDLDEIQSCTVKKVYGIIHTGQAKRKSAEAYVDAVTLQLDYTNGAKYIALPFYDKATIRVFEIRQRAEQAKEWQDLLSTRLARKVNKIEKPKNSDKRTYATIIQEATAFIKD